MKPEQADAIRNLKQTEGWDYFQQFIASKINYHKEKLMTCEESEVKEHRAAAKALQAVLIFVDKTIEEGMNEQ